MQRSTVLLRLILLAFLAAALPQAALANQEGPTPTGTIQPPPAILAPGTGEAIQGAVNIIAQAGGDTFQSAEILFAYADDPTGTWFLIDERAQPLAADTPVVWDTSLIADGDYTLRLVVIYTDGSRQTAEAGGLRVRNYTPVETATPAPPSPPTQTPAPQAGEAAGPAATPTPPPAPSATPSPAASSTPVPATSQPNPAALAPDEVQLNVLAGMMATFGAFALAGIYWSLRRLGKR